MKIEKINNAQIRCTLNKTDLSTRQIKLSELAYGTEKAQELFQDMMAQASSEFGFEADDVPLMIEAIPLSGDGIMLIITKVDNPAELDEKFSSLPNKNVRKFKKRTLEEEPTEEVKVHDTNQMIFVFSTLDVAMKVSSIIRPIYNGRNSLYKDNTAGEYFLILHPAQDGQSAFVGLQGLLSEYGKRFSATPITETFLSEHYESLIEHKAVQVLSSL